ncbi:ArsR/SmtB family transcription factor [Fodinicola feengrottensis]|uniref:ArsR/SmtB family transcription factor n=1 Tax=Fodinicola feengrottensis TaxID=435914 RepID=UPI0013CFDE3B|nr:helix-turn-helix domain-containing protein [Fodinicola feengrottensis]
MWAQPQWEEIRFCEPVDTLRVEVSLNPYASIPTLLFDALGGWDRGVPDGWRQRIARTASAEQRSSVRTMTQLGRARQPDCVIAPAPPADQETSLADALEQLRTTSPDTLLSDLDGMYGIDLPAQWQPVAREPRRWLRHFAGAAEVAAAVVAQTWTAAGRLLDKEIDRVGHAVVRGRTDLLLASLHPRARFTDDALWLPAIEGNRYEVRAKRLVLVPDGVWSAVDRARPGGRRDGLDRLPAARAAPAVRCGSGPRGAATATLDRLPALMGGVRARLLRAAQQPITIGDLAEVGDWAMSSVSRHCDWLAEAGLIERTRSGRTVLVQRTVLGHELVELFST